MSILILDKNIDKLNLLKEQGGRLSNGQIKDTIGSINFDLPIAAEFQNNSLALSRISEIQQKLDILSKLQEEAVTTEDAKALLRDSMDDIDSVLANTQTLRQVISEYRGEEEDAVQKKDDEQPGDQVETRQVSTTEDKQEKPEYTGKITEYDTEAFGREEVTLNTRETTYTKNVSREKKVISLAKKLANEKYSTVFHEKKVARNAVRFLSPGEASVFKQVYAQERRKASPGRLVGRGFEWLGEKTIGRIGEHYGEKYGKWREKKDKELAGKQGRWGSAYRFVRKKTKESNNVQQALGMIIAGGLKNTIKNIATAVGAAGAYNNTAKAFSRIGGAGTRIGSALKTTGKLAGSAGRLAIPAALLGVVAGGPAGALALGLGGGAVGVATGMIDDLKNMTEKQYAKSVYQRIDSLTGNRLKLRDLHMSVTQHVDMLPDARVESRIKAGRFIGRASTIAGGLTRGIWGGGIGGALGGLVLGTPGVVAGTLIGGGVGAASKLIADRATNKAVQSIATGKAFGLLSRLPLQSIEGMIQGNRWLTGQVELAMGRGSELQGQIYGWNSPLSVAINLAQLTSHTLSSYTAYNSLFKIGYSEIGRFLGNMQGPMGRFVGSPILNLANKFGLSPAQLRLLKNAPGLLSKTNLAAVGGSTAGSLAGSAIALALGLNVGLAAAVGGAIGGVTGAILVGGTIGRTIGAAAGGAVAATFSAGTLTVVGSTIGAAVGSFLGTVLGSAVDTIINRLLPSIPSPLVLVQGIYDLYKWLTAPLRNLTDYAAIGLTALSLINFLVALERILVPGNSIAGAEAAAMSWYRNELSFAAAETTYQDGNSKLVLNPNQHANYNFSGIEQFEILSEGRISFEADGRYWILENPGTYYYNPQTATLNGSSQATIASVYQYAAVAGASTDEGVSQPSKSELVQTDFCNVMVNLCQD